MAENVNFSSSCIWDLYPLTRKIRFDMSVTSQVVFQATKIFLNLHRSKIFSSMKYFILHINVSTKALHVKYYYIV